MNTTPRARWFGEGLPVSWEPGSAASGAMDGEAVRWTWMNDRR